MKRAKVAGPAGANVNQQTLRRQRWLLLALCVVAVAAAALIVWLPNPTAGISEIVEKTQLAIPGENLDAGQLWRASAEQDIKLLEDSEKKMRDALIALEQRLAEVTFEIEQARIAEQEAAFEREMILLSSMESPSEQAPPTNPSEAVIPPFTQPEIRLVRADSLAAVQPELAPATPVPEPPAVVEEITAATEQHGEYYLPSGTFMPAVILGGIDAPTGAVARDNPHPVLLRVAADARLPGLVRRNVRECLVLAAGYGHISSERALLRIERMSCKRHDGSFFDEQVRGFIVGDDGRAGVRGRLVTKQGQILQRSLIAGIGSGIGELFRTQQADRQRSLTATVEGEDGQAQRIQLSPNLDLGDYARTGVAAGAGSALGRLSEYYISLADQVYPIIEVGAGREVDIVLQEGVDLRAKPQAL